MSFTIKLQNNASEKIEVNKIITDVMTVTGTLREGTSIISPSFLVEADIENLVNVNYLRVDAFGRSYYINDISLYRTHLVQIDCHVDVLVSFSSTILAQDAIVSRQKNRYNLLLNDGSLHAYQNPHIIKLNFPNGLSYFPEIILLVAGSVVGGGRLTIIQQPTNQIVSQGDYGDIVKFVCVATGVGVNYQWQVDVGTQGSWADITGEESQNLSIAYNAVTATNSYRCLCTDTFGTNVLSNSVHIVEAVG